MTTPTKPVLRVSSLTDEPVRVPVYAEASGSPIDLVSLSAKMAFIPPNTDPIVSDWKPATWDVGDVIAAQCDIQGLAKGTYTMWLQIVSATNNVVKSFGTLVVY